MSEVFGVNAKSEVLTVVKVKFVLWTSEVFALWQKLWNN
jgi:hypothetical protein